ncbi:hypothetical protein VOLCADRAFT_97577 [Volvox carteri f. nagariensis]|uniref:Uncharacterized protein n=1 Tax=Volvox carteri f. nagariensis TaxID=3068 RepID=D8UD33_VOLCA|nr:uncharacterized protein VOLCADRAFT_97577 [Volvox carteri f. nagariensis]EFJ42324.1 hypothetical protein VOLCADRAFT_97577 [Volvox carteri f. nagariensis]|eukprot:XP_002956557.1 hypothetical protein VOLCADRAFT_97577 [Volvox carteri f. nagariensis]
MDPCSWGFPWRRDTAANLEVSRRLGLAGFHPAFEPFFSACSSSGFHPAFEPFFSACSSSAAALQFHCSNLLRGYLKHLFIEPLLTLLQAQRRRFTDIDLPDSFVRARRLLIGVAQDLPDRPHSTWQRESLRISHFQLSKTPVRCCVGVKQGPPLPTLIINAVKVTSSSAAASLGEDFQQDNTYRRDEHHRRRHRRTSPSWSSSHRLPLPVGHRSWILWVKARCKWIDELVTEGDFGMKLLYLGKVGHRSWILWVKARCKWIDELVTEGDFGMKLLYLGKRAWARTSNRTTRIGATSITGVATAVHRRHGGRPYFYNARLRWVDGWVGDVGMGVVRLGHQPVRPSGTGRALLMMGPAEVHCWVQFLRTQLHPAGRRRCWPVG